MEERILDILETVTGSDEVREDTALDLFDAGLLDSMGSVSLILELEQAFDIAIPISEFERENWASVEKIEHQVKELQNA
ncbi:MAG: D-alanine--poly(phosphoribitol) ligase subunit DltC [Lactobacillales bacterium]|jgi:D-alanine--poly(phosphoribitol) ligase subunit 2|nr:D-alanine--poly(phosphoribitol) ligase subunit DltC [Lactobacillales bacterium]